MISGLFSGFLVERLGIRASLSPGLTVFAASRTSGYWLATGPQLTAYGLVALALLVVALAPDPRWIPLATSLDGVALGLMLPSLWMVAMQRAPPDVLPRAPDRPAPTQTAAHGGRA